MNLFNVSRLCTQLLFACFFFLIGSCANEEANTTEPISKPLSQEKKIQEEQQRAPRGEHPYGGWYCPDNLRGFPAVDIQELSNVPVVNGRLPTEEETRNGTSLMHIDIEEFPNVKALDIPLPQAARYFCRPTEKNELIVVIQAVVIESDTVVGFRYLNGGNGSARFDEVTFVSDEEIEKMGSTPFVSHIKKIAAPKEKIWEVITSPRYAKELGKVFHPDAYVQSDWKPHAKVYFKYGPERVVNTGTITAIWENLYIQVDYDMAGYHYAEKFLVTESETPGEFEFHLTAGPYSQDIAGQEVVWGKWLDKVEELARSLVL